MKTIRIHRYVIPAGEILLGSLDGHLCLCDWIFSKKHKGNKVRVERCHSACFEEGSSVVIEKAIKELEEFFHGERTSFDIPILFSGTDFQCRVWNELTKIPFGGTVSYAELAHRIGNPNAVRAVANANASNAISIFVPCHRVVGSDGSLTGYAGGLSAKHLLLELESCG